MARIRNTKKLGQRVDRTYLKQLYPIPRWRRILTGMLVAAALAWLGIYAIARDQSPYTAGPLTPSHAFLGQKCADCHRAEVGIGKKVEDKQCAACHDAPLHQAEQTLMPPCITCHVEHRGVTQLASVSDRACTACHGNLQTKSGKHTVNASVESFDAHPQFAAVAAGHDPTGLRFNHQKHLTDVSQKCADCHPAADIRQPAHSHLTARAQMAIPTYAATCMPCHPLNVDEAVSDPAPHDKPEVVHKFMVEQLAKHGASSKLAADEEKLFFGTTMSGGGQCAGCHTMQKAAGQGLPTVVATAVPQRWFGKALFDHSAHQAIDCASCHPKAASSTSAGDLLIPGIETCNKCHAPGRASAGSECSTCHVYHDWSKEKGVEGKFKLSLNLNPTRSHPGQGAL